MPGADFGDEFVAAMMHFAEEEAIRQFDEAQRFVTAKVGQLMKFTARSLVKRVADKKRSTEQDAADMRDALENGPNGRFNFQDNIDQVITFDLSDFEGEARQAAKEHLEELLTKHGLDPKELVPQYEDVLQEDGTKLSVANGKFDFTFRDDQARFVTEVTGSYYNAALADPRVIDSLGLKGMNIHVAGLENITQAEKESLLKYMPETMGVSSKDISVVRNKDGEIEAISAFVKKESIDKAIESFNKNKGKLNLKDPTHEFSRKIRLELSTENAVMRKKVLTGRAKQAEMLSREFIASGALNTTVHVSQDGTIYYRAPQSELDVVNQSLNRVEKTLEMKMARGKASATRPEGSIPSWKETKAHAIAASEAERELAKRYLDPSKIRESLPKVPVPTK